MVSVLTKMLGFKNLDVAHDIVQDTLLKAMNVWGYGKIPDNPPAWLYTVAKNKAIDFLRSQKSRREVNESECEEHLRVSFSEDLFLDSEIQDSQLRMIFACCHPSIPADSQIALSLKTLCGLSVQEISRAFLTSEDTIAKRIYRAKEKIIQEKIDLEVPSGSILPVRLEFVLHVLYLMFNEGYNSSGPDELIRKDVCAEAMRLCPLLTLHPLTNHPSVNALLALMCFQASRFESRVNEKGNIITLRHQDRSTWNKSLIHQGNEYLDRGTENESITVYHIEAAIAGLHAASPSFDLTDWKSVYHLYEALYAMKPTPIVALNKAIASSYAISCQSALELLLQIKGLENHHLYHAALGEVHLSLGKKDDAKGHFERAINLTSSPMEQSLLTDKLMKCLG
jgi:RNA polymerase sigma-70 factor (ECF subfamily)